MEIKKHLKIEQLTLKETTYIISGYRAILRNRARK